MNAAPPTRRGLRARRVAAWILGPVLAVVLALAGIALGLRIASPGEYDTELGRVSVRVTPATHGQVEAYIPLADWGVRFHAFRAPMRLHLEPRTVERDVVIRAASGARAPVSATEAGLRTAVQKTVLARALRPRRRSAAGADARARAGGFRRAAPAVSSSAPRRWPSSRSPPSRAGRTLRPGPGELRRARPRPPTFFARGAELVQLLHAATNARAAGDGYASKVQVAVSGFASLLTDPTAGRVDDTRPALLASDLHNNRSRSTRCATTRATSPCSSSATSATRGSADEARLLAPGVAGLGPRVVAVSGNHDSTDLHAQPRPPRRDGPDTRRRAARGRPTTAGPFADVAGPARRRVRRPARVAREAARAIRERIFSFSELPDPAARATDAAQQDPAALVRRPAAPARRRARTTSGLAQWLAEQLRITRRRAAADNPHGPRPPPAHHDATAPSRSWTPGTVGASEDLRRRPRTPSASSDLHFAAHREPR